ncbi:hypothetical protein BBJ28_00000481 [Nothophytophthora sp. Chile5]|nr:hypothetical protein BBJ28_00000481 [Nothophytophthora sp. Chile5]
MRSANERGLLLRGLALLAIAVAFGAAQPAGEGDDPVKFGPVPSLPTRVEPYEPHEVLRSEERPQQTFGLSLAALVVLVAAGGKIGGGGVLDAVYLLVLKLQPDLFLDFRYSLAVADLLMNLWKKPLNSNTSLVNWDFMLVMQPMILMGASFGASMITLLPTWLFFLALLIYLGYTGTKTAKAALAVGREENWRWCSSRETVTLLGAPSSSFQDEETGFQYKAGIPWRKVGASLGLFGGTLLLTSLQGGKYFPSPIGIPPSSFLFLIVSMLPFVFLSVVSHYLMKDVVVTYQRQQNPRYILSLAQLTLPVGFAMTLLGRVCLVKLVRKAKFRTLLFFAIAAALLVSIVPLSFQEIRSMLGA